MLRTVDLNVRSNHQSLTEREQNENNMPNQKSNPSNKSHPTPIISSARNEQSWLRVRVIKMKLNETKKETKLNKRKEFITSERKHERAIHMTTTISDTNGTEWIDEWLRVDVDTRTETVYEWKADGNRIEMLPFRNYICIVWIFVRVIVFVMCSFNDE